MSGRSQRARQHRKHRRGRPGGSPGQIVVDAAAPRPRITVLAYDGERIEESEISDVASIRRFLDTYRVTWVNIDGHGDAATLEALRQLFDIHPLVLEDVVNVPQRPKIEGYGDQLFVVVHMLSRDQHLEHEQLGICLGERFLLTFQERPGDPFDPVRERLRTSGRRIRQRGSDYLAYALIDATVDHYFPVLESLQEQLTLLEDELRTPGPDPLPRIRDLRREILEIHRATGPLREVVRALASGEWPLVEEGTRVFLRDCYDHALAAGDGLEACRQIASGLMDIHLSTVSHQVNATMKVLTVIATIFMPLSFIAGVYGMNFDSSLPGNMPELGWPYAYLGVLGGMAALGVGLLIYFRRKGWF